MIVHVDIMMMKYIYHIVCDVHAQPSYMYTNLLIASTPALAEAEGTTNAEPY